MSATTLYPPSPVLTDTSFLEPSSEFRSKTTRMIFGILMFIVLYVMLIFFSIALLFACGALAIAVISFKVMWVTVVVAVGLIALGIMFFFFTIKFIFARTEEQTPLEIQVHEKDHPALFDFIRKLSKEVGTKFPRKIFLVPDVNASVSYNSSFWSMFLPVRKNLRIGLGLVNTLTLSEFKATIAHEFGHFSQRSMKASSYVYTMNKVIYNLTFQRDKYDELLAEWASGGNLFSMFALLTSLFVESVRAILRSSYNKLNVTLMALSREMEYHADLVACSVAGNDAMVNTLRKIELGDATYNQTINSLNDIAARNKQKISDIYSLHSKLITHLSISRKLELKNGLPIITSADISKGAVQSRLLIKDQWASHPSREDREASISRYSVPSSLIHESAWVLFSNPQATREAMTSQMYADNDTTKDLTVINDKDVDAYVEKLMHQDSMPPTFEGIYDDRMISKFDPDKLSARSITKSFSEVINPSVREMIREHRRNVTDLEDLGSIAYKKIRVDFFEFDGKRYKASEAPALHQVFEKEVENGWKRIQTIDEEIFLYYRQRAADAGRENEFVDLYRSYFTRYADTDITFDFAMRFQTATYEVSIATHQDHIISFCLRIQDIEKAVKKYMRGLPAEAIDEYFDDPEKVHKYLQTEKLWNYSDREYTEQNVAILHRYIIATINAANENKKEVIKDIFRLQLELTPPEFLRTE